MSLKSALSKPYAHYLVGKLYKSASKAVRSQELIREEIVRKAGDTKFGRDHNFDQVKTYEDFKRAVPIRDYEDLKPYIELIKEGEENVLWPGKPEYLAKTSGTTSGSKYIPITKESIPNHINGAKLALLCNIYHTGSSKFVNGNMIFLSGSPELTQTAGILTGRLSGIVNHHVPNYLKGNQVPSYEINCIDDWEEKVENIVSETVDLNMSLISGIPPWVLMYFERLLEKSGRQTIKALFPNFEVFVYGGVNYDPYRAQMDKIIGGTVQTIETYPASEGFIAFQDLPKSEGLLLHADSGIFFEFIPADEVYGENPTRLQLKDIELHVNYALIINSNAGLWGYNIGDTIKFVSKDPYRVIVTGRIKHFISAFGEHVIGEEVDNAMSDALATQGGEVIEYHVAPKVNTEDELPYHEWFVAFQVIPNDMDAFAQHIDDKLRTLNTYYEDLRVGNMLQRLKINVLPADTFREYMKRKGKLGGQNKVPRLANDRKVADELA